MIAVVETVSGRFAVDLETAEIEPWDAPPFRPPEPVLNLPRLVAAAAAGATVIAIVDTKPPLVVSHDAGTTWRESGRGLPPGRAVALAADDPDVIVFASRNRLYLTRDGGVFWSALVADLPEITGLGIET